MAGKRAALATMRSIERFTRKRAWADLTDEEFLWEPPPGGWTSPYIVEHPGFASAVGP